MVVECACMTATYENLTMPRAAPSAFNANACIEVSLCPDEPPTVTCRCFDDVNGRGGDLLDADADGCLWPGGPGGCLFAVDELPGCDPSAPGSCDDVCATIHARETDEAARIYAVERRGVRCHGGTCEGILQIDDHCYVTHDLAHPHDCGLSDPEIFAQYDALAAEPAADPCVSGSTGT